MIPVQTGNSRPRVTVSGSNEALLSYRFKQLSESKIYRSAPETSVWLFFLHIVQTLRVMIIIRLLNMAHYSLIVAYDFTISFIGMTSSKARDPSYTRGYKIRLSSTGENGRKPDLICKKILITIWSCLIKHYFHHK